jgi:hypothetical protein
VTLLTPSRFALAVVLCAAAAAPSTAEAQSANSEAAMVLRILNYDRSLSSRVSSGGRVTLIALYDPSDASSRRFCEDLSRAVVQLGRVVRVGGKRAHAELVAYSGTADLIERGRAARAVGVYVCPGLESRTAAISAATRSARLLSMTPAEAEVRAGLTVGLVRGGSQLRLFVNVTAARAEGARLDAALLRLATVVR